MSKSFFIYSDQREARMEGSGMNVDGIELDAAVIFNL